MTESRDPDPIAFVVVIAAITLICAFVYQGCFAPDPPAKPECATKPSPRAEEIGEEAGERSRRFGGGFLKGWRRGTQP